MCGGLYFFFSSFLNRDLTANEALSVLVVFGSSITMKQVNILFFFCLFFFYL